MAYNEVVQNATAPLWPIYHRDFLSFYYSGTVASLSDKMPSIRSLLSAFSLITQTVLGLRNPVHRLSGSSLAASASCPNAQLSCHNSSAVDNLCCFNAPGGTLLQTQFWDTNPASGPEDSWTIHGLWVSKQILHHERIFKNSKLEEVQC